MATSLPSTPVRVAVSIADGPLADRVAALLGGVDGLMLVSSGEGSDVVVSQGEREADTTLAQSNLTPREREVLSMLATGASNKLIARQLGISIHTAKFHVGQILDKLDATGRTDAVAHAARLGIIEL